ncbi:SRPBCC family protein [Saccharopolyspora sp. HNM0983]|uniref:SRPBCC family protein n=1 Tax=Saccharopolyspora montiporae TaxID=2781240 RepID=A0A929G253_9PSEU|nr:SRPBCC family protein [Saccharopolyspora sp. HNM0983]MBE9375398.1 SRPBCC family protein [Saccharopolyspora sp. HNM0983]
MTDSVVTELDAGTRRIARQVVVDATPHELFEVLADPRRHGELDGSGTLRDTVSGPERLGQGTAFAVNMRQFGVPYRITSTVVAFEEGRAIEWRHPFGHTWRWDLAETGSGGTTVTETFDYSGTKHAKVLEMMGIPGKNATSITRTLEQLPQRFAG